MLRVGGRHQRLAALAEQAREQLTAGPVELGHDVVEEHQRLPATEAAEKVPLGEQQREQGRPLLSLRPVGAQGDVLEEQLHVVAVGAVRREAARQVRLAPLGQLGGETRRVGGVGPRPVTDLGGPGQAQRLGVAGEWVAQAVHGL